MGKFILYTNMSIPKNWHQEVKMNVITKLPCKGIDFLFLASCGGTVAQLRSEKPPEWPIILYFHPCSLLSKKLIL